MKTTSCFQKMGGRNFRTETDLLWTLVKQGFLATGTGETSLICSVIHLYLCSPPHQPHNYLLIFTCRKRWEKRLSYYSFMLNQTSEEDLRLEAWKESKGCTLGNRTTAVPLNFGGYTCFRKFDAFQIENSLKENEKAVALPLLIQQDLDHIRNAQYPFFLFW